MADATATAADPLHLVVVTPERAVLDARADFVALPMYDGELGVLTKRAPLIGRLGAGELRYTARGRTHRYFVEAGFVQVRSDVVTVLTDRAVPAAEITPAVAERVAAEADALPANTAAEQTVKARARARAAGMRKVAARVPPVGDPHGGPPATGPLPPG